MTHRRYAVAWPTLLALVIDRRREFALLRFLGAAQSQIRRIILCEAGLLGLLANGIGIVLGTLLSLILSDILVLLLRPDQQDFQGTAVTVEVARKLKVKRLLLVVNKVLPKLDKASLRQQVQTAYDAPVASILPVSEELIELGSAGIFSTAYPDHPDSQGVRELATQIGNPA